MSATAIAQAAIQYAPQAISAAKSLIAKFAPQVATAVEGVSQTVGTVADSGIAQNILQAKDLISSDTSITNKLFGLSTHLSETHPEIASKLEGYAIKLLNKAGLSDEEVSFLHDQLTEISSFEAKEESKLTDSKPKVEPTADDVHILINLIAKGDLDPSREEAYIKTLNSQTAVPLAEVKQKLIEATKKHHPSEQVIEEPPTINSSGVEQSSSVSILDNSLTDEQQKIILDASKKIPIQVDNKSLSNLVQEYLPYEGIQSTLSALGVEKPDFFSALTKIAMGGAISLGDYKTTVSSLLSAFTISIENQDHALNNFHTKHEMSIAQGKPKQVENVDSQAGEAKPAENKLPQTKEELESLVQERIASAGHSTTPGDENPIGQILHGVSSIVLGEFSNMSSEVGWLMKFYLKSKGVENLDQNTVKSYLNKFTEGDFIQNLATYLKSSDKNEVLKTVAEKDQTAIKWIGNLVSIGAHTPSWVLDTVAMAGTALDYTAEILHHVPVIGGLLKIPFLRKGIVGISQFAGRFTKDIKLIKQGAENLVGVPKPETVKNPEPELATANT